MSFWVYSLTAHALCLGERTKRGTYRASLDVSIPYSQITGALRAAYGGGGHEFDLHAVGRLKSFQREHVMRGVRDRILGVSTLPLEAEVLTNVEGKVYVAVNDYTMNLPVKISLSVGAFRSQGLGECLLERHRDRDPLEIREIRRGELAVRLPADEETLQVFGVEAVEMPVWGYLFRPDEYHVSGEYVRALFEGSVVQGPAFLLREAA
jgi:hypothetical protein